MDININEFKKAMDILVKEKGIKEEIIYDALELALTSAYKKNYHSLSNVRVSIDRTSADIHVYSFKTVVLDEEHEAKARAGFIVPGCLPVRRFCGRGDLGLRPDRTA